MKNESEKVIEHLFRSEYGKILSILTGFFGTTHIQLAEDVVQETLISALDNWSTQGIPSNPTGWLVLVAKRKALNELKRNKSIENIHKSGIFEDEYFTEIEPIFLENEIKDNQLRMIFTCCHPSLDIKSQIALTLKTLCGFGVKEVARALLNNEATIGKRLYRAKEKIKTSNIPFTIPNGIQLNEKLDTVGLTLYLLFNEGYNSSTGETLIQKELCLEAIRLTKLLVTQFEDNYKLNALLALMCFHTARFEARIDDKGAIILFEDQNRALWNTELIQIGMRYFKNSIHAKQISAYHIEARIAAEHCLANSFDETNWHVIHAQYLLLSQLKPNPIIQLNLAIIQSKIGSIEDSLAALENLARDETLSSYHLLPATQGILYMQLNNFEEAQTFLKKALMLSPSNKERNFIESKLVECAKKSSTN